MAINVIPIELECSDVWSRVWIMARFRTDNKIISQESQVFAHAGRLFIKLPIGMENLTVIKHLT